ncbi:hypothetical protein [Curtobacterium sp. ISL-83]|uniref:hypothetical protein n=1 Tax=Curtobacterium sp. ISL-83 TaxID=2819145 RepID=UPI001BE67E00|nr:hypothetical protein [Curtobacterium sp. ISL-83]MBT2501684.1 hypothetical protein [Curtobacterium sp. ISL-83]
MQLLELLVIAALVSVACSVTWILRRPTTPGGKLSVVTIWTASSAVALVLAVLVLMS